MYWVVTYDVPATHDEWRVKVASTLSSFGLFRVQFSVFVGDRTVNTIQACKLKLEQMLKVNHVPADIRFYPLCKQCEQGAARINSENYRPGARLSGVPSNVLVGP